MMVELLAGWVGDRSEENEGVELVMRGVVIDNGLGGVVKVRETRLVASDLV